MTFNNKEAAAILNISRIMAKADGHISDSEMHNVLKITSKFDLDEIETIAETLNGNQSANVLAEMTDTKKLYICCYFAEMMKVDGKISDEEVRVWQIVSQLADFPSMTINDALNMDYKSL